MKDLEPYIAGEVRTPDERGRISVSITPPAVAQLLAWSSDAQVKSIHESGHACVSVLLGVKVKTLDIKPRFGGCTVVADGDEEEPSIRSASAHLNLVVIALAAREAEIAILGEPTDLNSSDISYATNLARARFVGGMDLDAPAGGLDIDFFTQASAVLGDALISSIVQTLTTARERARVLVAEHKDQIIALARIIYEARRLSDEPLAAAFREIGLDPDRK